ncbi:hypothetical protein EVAR_3052_1 [Eumeta japonica]|uniref:Uncharacterized protein n=1 Tax=Eumeta variegata TaxID=151549 RepID=A0A4C1SUE5_EUMVA|nr:hypothetical protein EVAR_3052_1 [Eumeta japonica]
MRSWQGEYRRRTLCQPAYGKSLHKNMLEKWRKLDYKTIERRCSVAAGRDDIVLFAMRKESVWPISAAVRTRAGDGGL